MRIAIVGSGIAGLGSARLLTAQGHAVTLYEADSRLGGHTRTVDVTLEGVTAAVDTGFLVFNDRTYPKLVALFAELGVPTIESEMSFSVRVDGAGLEWAGTNLASVFAQPRNAARADFWRMLADIRRFNRATRAQLRSDAILSISLAEYLDRGGYSRAFRDWYLLPMAAAIWSAPKALILDFPLRSFLHFCDNHGLLQVSGRPRWRTVEGGARRYVERIASELADVRLSTPVTRVRRGPHGVEVDAADGAARYDEVVFACHSDQALAVLADPTPAEARSLPDARFQHNRAVLHTDPALMPRRRAAWSAWNYLALADVFSERAVCVSYWINRLQRLPFAAPVIVTLNAPFAPDPSKVLDQFEFSHPLQDERALTARALLARHNGANRTWYAGAWLGHGFHEDGLASAHAVAHAIAARAAGSEPGEFRLRRTA